MRRLLRTLLFFLSLCCCHSWEWSDLIRGDALFQRDDTLSLAQVSQLRVREIKRRLARSHGYGADELARMLDKKELIEALAFEEHKIRQVRREEFQRQLFVQAVIVTILAGAVVLFWPLIKHVWDVAHVNFVVYSDRKRLEARRCWELKSYQGSVGVLCMFIVDVLQIWLTVTVILSWFMTSKYFFPIPSLSIRPAAMMGGEVANGPLARYGINVGPMVLTWGFRFLQGKLEMWTGRAFSVAYRAQVKENRKESRKNETPEEKEARRAARRARRAVRKEEQRRKGQEEELPYHSYETLSHEPISSEQKKIEPRETTKASRDEKRQVAAAAAEARLNENPIVDRYTAMDELD